MFLVLHGQTEWNRDGLLQGHSDSPLTTEGRAQAMRSGAILRAHLKGVPRIIASPLGRTQATAHIIAQCIGHTGIETDARLAELRLGSWEGLNRVEIAARWPDRWNPASRNLSFFNAPEGEDYGAIHQRLHDWYAALEGHENIIAVSHGIASRVLRGIHLKLDKVAACELEVARDAPFHLNATGVEKLAPP